MQIQPISEELRHIIDAMRALIEKNETKRLKEDTEGWRYGGQSFIELVASLQKEIKEELTHQNLYVDFCTVRHFFKGANITPSNPSKRLLVIPINGISTLSPGGQLPIDRYCYIDNTPTLSGNDIDVIFVIYEVKNETA
ncbi:hypothetical protein CBS147326_2831 [Penicillium roqueforti]|nr:hypothetical protein CBS147326_2831 [Penicillium roqueforti]